MVSLNIADKGIATLTFDDPDSKVNVLSMSVMDQFSSYLDEIQSNDSLSCLIVRSSKSGVFIAGANINEIQKIKTANEAKKLIEKGQEIFTKLSSLPIPSIAVINGVCLGGGLELALACTYRMASLSQKTSIGLPEVNLGIIPGFGGTQRLPRLIGLTKSLNIILTGKPVSAKKALRLRMVDCCYPLEFEESYIDQFIDSVCDSKLSNQIKVKRKLSFFEWLAQSTLIGRSVICMGARRSIRKKSKGKYPAPEKALKAAVSGISLSLEKGLALEAKLFSQCIETSVSRYLIQLFFSQEEQKKIMSNGGKAKSIQQAGVIGAGLMGSGIAWAFSYRHIPVVLTDLKSDDLMKGVGSIKRIFNQLKSKRRMTSRDLNLAMHRVVPSLNYQSLSSADMVVEAVVEKADIKQQVYAKLESILSPDAIIATNTSSLCIDSLSKNLSYPERFIGMHFFSPVNRMPLVEIIPSKHTSSETLAATLAMVKKMKKTAVVVKNCPGFLVNRVFLPYVNEAMYCLLDGANILQIDKALTRFGMPLGPLSLSDQVGLDIGLHVLKILEKGYVKRMQIPTFAESVLFEKGWLGVKTGKGFYHYEKNGKGVNKDLVDQLKALHIGNRSALSDDEVIERCVFVMINEASRCLDHGIVASPRELDLAMIMGTGFPPFRGGLCQYADQLGIPYIVERLEYYSRVFGSRFEPSLYLKRLVEKKQLFYSKEEM